MAVRADDIGKLINQNSPYIHSNIVNFNAIHQQSLLQANNKNRINEILERLSDIRKELKDQADSFLGGHTPKQFIKQYYFGSGKNGKEKMSYYKAFTLFFQSPQFYYSMNQKMGYKLEEISKYFNIQFSGEKLPDMLPEGALIKLIMNDVINITGKEKGRFTYNFKLDQTKFKRGLQKIFNANEKKSVNKMTNELRTLLRDKSKKGQLQGGKIDLANETKNRLDSEECKQFISQIIESDGFKFNENQFDIYRNNISNYLIGYLSNKTITQQSELSGAMGEEFEISILQGISDKNLGGFLLTGTWDEKKIRTELSRVMKNYSPNKELSSPNQNTYVSWKPDEGLPSYSDFILVNPENRQRARVQAKYYEEIIAKFKPNEQNMTQHIELFKRKETIPEFIKELQNTGQVFSQLQPDAIAYVIANSLWFSYAGSVDRKGKVSKQDIDNRIIFRELGVGIGNFLGIILDEQFKPIQEFSNLFFWINNEILLPTWVIIDELYKMIKDHPATSTISKISMTKSANGYAGFLSNSTFGETATAFKAKKKKAVAEKGENLNYFRGESGQSANYTSPELLNVGREQGEKIINGTDAAQAMNMRKINLDINYENAIKSAYNIFK